MKRKTLSPKRFQALLLALALLLSMAVSGCGAPAGDAGSTVPASESASPEVALREMSMKEMPEASPSDQTEVSPLPEPSSSAEPSPYIEPSNTPELSPSVEPTPSAEPEATDRSATPPEGSSFAVHYIDVGQADAALVLCDGHAMLIDGGNAEDSNLIYSYLRKLSVNYLDYIVCTHAHEDHVGGLSGALNYATVGTAFSPVTDYDSRAFRSFVNYLAQQGVAVTVPSAGQSFALGSAAVSVLGPIYATAEDVNNTSIVLRIVYGDTSFLFTGDAEREEEQAILAAGYDLGSTVLKVGHHGSDSSTSYVWLREIMPEYAVISVGKGNSYGHPTEALLSRLRDAGVKTYRTDMQGDVVCTSDGKTVSFSVERNADADTLAEAGAGGGSAPESSVAPVQTPVPSEVPVQTPEPEIVTPIPVGTDYILNTNTHKFHYPSCSSVGQMSEKNKQAYTGNREDVINMGYVPCKRCKP